MKHSCVVKSAMSAALLGFLALGMTSTSASAQANPATTTFQVSATVLKDCIVSATAMGFGNYTGAINHAQSTVTVTCTSGTSYTVGLDAGKGTSATTSARQMCAGACTTVAAGLNYGLYTDGGWTTIWGNSGTAPLWVLGTGNGAGQGLTGYGQIPAGQYVSAAGTGVYTDTITATVTY